MTALGLTRIGSQPARPGGDRAGWTALVVVVVLGIIGMHAIGLHGIQHADPGSLAAPSAIFAMPVTGHHDAIAATHGGSQAKVAVMVPNLNLGHGVAGMAMLCIAVLIGFGLALRRIEHQRRSPVPLRQRMTTSVRADRRTDVRQTGPPVVLAFSVSRC